MSATDMTCAIPWVFSDWWKSGLKHLDNMDVATKLSGSFTQVLNFATRANEDGEKEIPFFVPKLFRGDVDQQSPHSFQSSPNTPLGTIGLNTMIANGTNSGHSTPSRPGTPLKTFCGINPELYKCVDDGELSEYPVSHIGRIWFTLDYDRDSEKLSVAVGKVRNLPSRELMNANCCDPFVRVYLLPDERRYSQTKTRRKTCNPKYEDHFGFDVSKDLFDERSVKLVVYDVDNLKRNIPIGSVVYNLREYTICKQRRLATWKDLKKDDVDAVCQLGELQCSLCYNDTLQRLIVDIMAAKELKPADDTLDADTFVKVVLSIGTKQVKCKKTHVVKNNLNNPLYKESFTFNLAPDRLDQTCICLQVLQSKTERLIGRVVLGGSMLAKGKALQHWQEMIHKKKEMVQEWHYLTD